LGLRSADRTRLVRPQQSEATPCAAGNVSALGHNASVLLDELVRTSAEVAATSSRRAKTDAIANLLRSAEPAEVPVAVAFLSGELRQRQIGVGYAALREIAGGSWPPGAGGGDGQAPAAAPTDPIKADTAGLTLTAVDVALTQIGAAIGPGSQAERRRLLALLFATANHAERAFLTRLIAGDLRQGALEGVMVEAIAAAAGVPAVEVRRAHMLGGSLLAVAAAALAPPAGPSSRGTGATATPRTDPGPGNTAAQAALAALRSFRLQVGRPLQPMLASSAESVQAALERVCPAAVEWKIDGIRVQVHRDGADVAVFTRTLDDITARVPEVVTAVAAMPARSVVLDGEIIALGPDGRPRPFQITAGRTGNRSDVARLAGELPLTAFFFDLLHLDGADLVDAPGTARFARLAATVGSDLVIPRIVTGTEVEATSFFQDAVARGHEGVLVKSLDMPYAAGRRGAGWIKVKPRHTLDLVVIAAEWGHGRRRGWLSNLHLAARDPVSGGHVMLGKTFKGLTDEILTWQTARLLELADPPPGLLGSDGGDAGSVVPVRPELVVEIAFDGVQRSRRYPGGLALRFARVIRYRPDKRAEDADTIETVRQIAGTAGLTLDSLVSEGAREVLDPVDEV
jgi:DNA ligase-1